MRFPARDHRENAQRPWNRRPEGVLVTPADDSKNIQSPGLSLTETQRRERNGHFCFPASSGDLAANFPNAIPVQIEAPDRPSWRRPSESRPSRDRTGEATAATLFGHLPVVLDSTGIGSEDISVLLVLVGIQHDLNRVIFPQASVPTSLGDHNLLRLLIEADNADKKGLPIKQKSDFGLAGWRELQGWGLAGLSLWRRAPQPRVPHPPVHPGEDLLPTRITRTSRGTCDSASPKIPHIINSTATEDFIEISKSKKITYRTGMGMKDIEHDDFWHLEHDGWERAARNYERCWTDHTFPFIPPLLQATDVSAGTRLLDLACGPGYVSEQAGSVGANPVGVDFSSHMDSGGQKEESTTRLL